MLKHISVTAEVAVPLGLEDWMAFFTLKEDEEVTALKAFLSGQRCFALSLS